jgi:thiol-disulfide isomerase/thioredoxin
MHLLCCRHCFEGQAVRVVAWMGMIAFCLGLTGCSLVGKKSAGSANTPNLAATDRDLSLPPGRLAGTGADPSTPPPGLSGMLAGQVLDSYNHRPPVTYIQVTDLQAPQGSGVPIDVAADSQGYFTIMGLQPGRDYQLTARARDGNRVLAGMVLARPPNPKLVIWISEDLATASTPPLPPTTTWPGPVTPPNPNPAAPKSNQAKTDQPSASPAWIPGSATAPAAPRQPTDGQTPAGSTPSPGPAAQPSTSPAVTPGMATERIVDDQDLAKRRQTPPVSIPNQTGGLRWTPPAVQPPQPKQDSPVPATGPTRVPSCQLTGQLLYNFALNDLTGQPWEYRLHHRGRLVLLDFWETTCVPCQYAVPHLKGWQETYGPYGLEIIGIAYEQGTAEERALKVNRVRQRLAINYRLLMGSDPVQCPVKVQFGVQAYPTLVLLDDNGRIIWHSEGLTKDSIAELETIFKQRLGVR